MKRCTVGFAVSRGMRPTMRGAAASLVSSRGAPATVIASSSSRSTASRVWLAGSPSRRGYASGAASAVKTIEVYATSWCPFCERVRALLKSKGVQFTEIDVSDPAIKEQMIKRTNGKKTVPQVFIDGEYIGDCEGTHKLDAQGLLDVKLGLKEQSTA